MECTLVYGLLIKKEVSYEKIEIYRNTIFVDPVLLWTTNPDTGDIDIDEIKIEGIKIIRRSKWEGN